MRSGSRVFSEYETTTGGTWRLAGVTDYFSSCEHGWHIAPTCTGADAIEAVKIAIAEAERLGGKPLAQLLPVHPETGDPVRIKLVTDNGGAFKGAAFAKFIASRPELLHIRTRVRSPGQNGVRERAFGSLKYEHLYRHADQIATLADLHREAEHYRMIFNQIRPHEALAMRRPIEIIADPSLHPIHNIPKKESVPEAWRETVVAGWAGCACPLVFPPVVGGWFGSSACSSSACNRGRDTSIAVQARRSFAGQSSQPGDAGPARLGAGGQCRR
jgi:hypothetical protein